MDDLRVPNLLFLEGHPYISNVNLGPFYHKLFPKNLSGDTGRWAPALAWRLKEINGDHRWTVNVSSVKNQTLERHSIESWLVNGESL